MKFFTGIHHPSHAKHISPAFISVETLWNRKGDVPAADWVLDSGAFTRHKMGKGHRPVEEYAAQIRRWKRCGNLLAAVAQDYMCEAIILERTGLTILDHQRLTIERYDALVECDPGCYIMPVLQGYEPEEYVRHVRMYGDRLAANMWVGVGSVCKRNADVSAIEAVLLAIHHERPDLALHGFGVKLTALGSGLVQELLATADSMAWSFNARKNGRNQNDWREAKKWAAKISDRPSQRPLYIPKETTC